MKLCKRTIKKVFKQNIDVDTELCRFLIAYRNTEHATTGESPAKILQGRSLRMRLDNLKPDRESQVAARQARNRRDVREVHRCFPPGATVWYHDYRSSDKWRPGVVIKQVGNTDYNIKPEIGTEIHRHVDQLRKMVTKNVQSEIVGQSINLD